MRATLKAILVLTFAALSASCKLAVVVVEGGEVQSTGLGTCTSGSVCTYEVNDTEFDQIFTAVPDTGWYFDKWNAGSRFFCENSRNSECGLYFVTEARTNTTINNLVASSEVFYLMPIFKRYPQVTLENTPRTISVEGQKQLWLQPADFVGYSYNQVSEVCPQGVCSGHLPGSTVDLTGHFWASSYDVQLLDFAYDQAGVDKDSAFSYTLGLPYESGAVIGILSDQPQGPEEEVTLAFALNLGISMGKKESSPTVGVWFWRPLH